MLLAIRTVEGIQAVSGENFSYSLAGSPKTGHVGGAVGEGATAVCRFATAARFLGGLRLPAGIELHPDGEFFFAKDFAGDLEEALEAVAEQRLPELADEGELVAEGVGRADGGSAQQVEQVHRLGVGQRNERPGGKVFRHLLRYLAVDGFFGQGAVFEELLEGPEGLIAVGGPEQQQLFEGGCAMGHALGLAGEPLLRRFLAADDA